jgi:hypothetical protein
LNVSDEATLLSLKKLADQNNIANSIFLEPDIGHQYTALALAPLQDTQTLTKRLKLANFKIKQ